MDEAAERGKLLDYLPEFMQQFLEIREIMQAEDREMDTIDKNVQDIIENAFIETCNEYGIQKYEALLGITADSQDGLEWRRSRVLARWNDFKPFTYASLMEKLDELCGPGNYTVRGVPEDYWLSVGVLQNFTGQINEVQSGLEKMLPQNIGYEVFEERPISGHIYVGAIMQQAEIVNIRQVI